MPNHLVLCGGTGAHVGAAFLRLHTLGYVLGYFRSAEQSGAISKLPRLYLVDQDIQDGEKKVTAHQLVRDLLLKHPARDDWRQVWENERPPDAKQISPVPVGPDKARGWAGHRTKIADRFGGDPLSPVFFQGRLNDIDFSKGMIASPVVGAFLFRLKLGDTGNARPNHDAVFSDLVNTTSADTRTVVVGSGMGGTGASVGPVIADYLADTKRGQPHKVLAITVLNWFALDHEGDASTKAKARNEVLSQNGASAMRFYGASLGSAVAAAPIGLPSGAWTRRTYTGDLAQETRETYIHAVAALAAWHHLTSKEPLAQGLYASGATDAGRIDPHAVLSRPSPGAHAPTLQELANRARTFADALKTLERALEAPPSRPESAIVAWASSKLFSGAGANRDAFREIVAALRARRTHYEEQILWLINTLKIQPERGDTFDLERAWRDRLGASGASRGGDVDRPPLHAGDSADRAAGKLFEWLGRWVQEQMKPPLYLRELMPMAITGYLPEREGEGNECTWEQPCVLVKVTEPPRFMNALVDHTRLTVNGWPHHFGAADHFRDAIERKDPRAVRQLEMLLVGLADGFLRLTAPAAQGNDALTPVGLTQKETKSAPWKGLNDRLICDAEGTVYGATSPFTLLYPVPLIDNEDALWERLWIQLTGRTLWTSHDDDRRPHHWFKNQHIPSIIRHWAALQIKNSKDADAAPPWLKYIFSDIQGTSSKIRYGNHPTAIEVIWSAKPEERHPSQARKRIRLAILSTSPIITASLGGSLDDVSRNASQFHDRFPLGLPDIAGFSKIVDTTLLGDKAPKSYIWAEHLDTLRDDGQITAWFLDDTSPDGRAIVCWNQGGVEMEHLPGLYVLDTRQMFVTQVPAFLHHDDNNHLVLRLPDVPLRARYLPLLLNEAGAGVFEEWKRSSASWALLDQAHLLDHGRVRWSVGLRGRPTPYMAVATLLDELRTLDVSHPEVKQQAPQAQVMVWPSFRLSSENHWLAYYVRLNFSRQAYNGDVVWVHREGQLRTVSGGSSVSRLPPSTHAVSWQEGRHDGGPPLAIALLHSANDVTSEVGLLLVQLDTLGSSNLDVDLAVDFGTSHSAAAVMRSNERLSLRFGPDLDRELRPTAESLTHHILRDPVLTRQIVGTGRWMPTYTAAEGGYVPTSLCFSKRFRDVSGQLTELRRGADYVLGALDTGSTEEEIADHVFTTLKWADPGEDTTHRSMLQSHYLAGLLELTLASAVKHVWRSLRSGRSAVTFTWPLRETDAEVNEFERNVDEILRDAATVYGLKGLERKLYDESSAARFTQRDGRLVLVADLGGGTLDIHISQEGSNTPTPIVADSIRLGGGELLQRLCDANVLPESWPTDMKRKRQVLELWMRVLGAGWLYGDREGEHSLPARSSIKNYVSGGDVARKAQAKQHVFRYFGHILELLARYLVAYAHNHLTPEERKRLLGAAVLQLRGNGWRLHPMSGIDGERSKLGQLAEKFAPVLARRATALWTSSMPDDPTPPTITFSDPGSYHETDPKLEPVKQALKNNEVPDDVRRGQKRHTLAEVEVITASGTLTNTQIIPWWSDVPLKMGHVTRIVLPNRTISPPLPLLGPGHLLQGELRELSVPAARQINEDFEAQKTETDEGHWQVPIAAIVFERIALHDLLKPRDGK